MEAQELSCFTLLRGLQIVAAFVCVYVIERERVWEKEKEGQEVTKNMRNILYISKSVCAHLRVAHILMLFVHMH